MSLFSGVMIDGFMFVKVVVCLMFVCRLLMVLLVSMCEVFDSRWIDLSIVVFIMGMVMLSLKDLDVLV